MKKTLRQKLLDRLRKSATKVNPKAKKSFKTMGKAQGISKKRIKAALRQASKASRPARVKTAAVEAAAPESAGPVRAFIAGGQRIAKAAGQFRTTGGRSFRRRK